MRQHAAIAALALGTACVSTSAPIYYSMNRHAPLLRARSDVHIGAHLNGERGVAVEWSKAISDKTVVLATFSTANHDPCATCDFDKHDYGEIALGRLHRTESGVVRARFVGLGAGSTAGSGCGGSLGGCIDYMRAEGTFVRAFAQFDRPGRSRRISTAISVRASAVYFTRYSLQPADTSSGTPFGVFLEPTYLIRIRLTGPLAANVQAGAALPLSPATSFGQIPTLGGIGLTMNW